MTPTQVRKALNQKGYDYSRVANLGGFKKSTVRNVVRRWAGATRGFPGGKAYYICLQISLLIGNPINDRIADEVALKLKEKP